MEDMSSTENNHKTHSCMNTNVIISVTVTKLEMDPEKKKTSWNQEQFNGTGCSSITPVEILGLTIAYASLCYALLCLALHWVCDLCSVSRSYCYCCVHVTLCIVVQVIYILNALFSYYSLWFFLSYFYEYRIQFSMLLFFFVFISYVAVFHSIVLLCDYVFLSVQIELKRWCQVLKCRTSHLSSLSLFAQHKHWIWLWIHIHCGGKTK